MQLVAHQAFDSRGRPTVSVELTLGDIRVEGDVPAGASTGKDEARTVPVDEALAQIARDIAPLLQTRPATDAQACLALEQELIARAQRFSHLGANAVLPVSRALWRMAAALEEQPLHAFIAKRCPWAKPSRVRFLMNIFNGALHALRPGEVMGVHRIDLQEIMIVPLAETYADALRLGEQVDRELGVLLCQQFPKASVTRGDEAGFTVSGLGDSDRAIALVVLAMERAGIRPGVDMGLAVDAAATSFFSDQTGTYRYRGETRTSAQMVDYWEALARRYAGLLLSLEDGLSEDDWNGWTELTARLSPLGVLTIGDDLFVTQHPRLARGLEARAASAILIKVNQNGSVGGTLMVMEEAVRHGMQCVVSHRSGETLDDSIADLAHATGAWGLKAGDPQPTDAFPDPKTWARRRKYLRMIEISSTLL